jgi:hypothetical protein
MWNAGIYLSGQGSRDVSGTIVIAKNNFPIQGGRSRVALFNQQPKVTDHN